MWYTHPSAQQGLTSGDHATAGQRANIVRRLRATVLLLRISHFTASLHSQFHSSRDSLRLLCQSSIIISRHSPSRWECQSPNKARLVNRWGSLQPLMSSLTQISTLLPTCAATPAVPALKSFAQLRRATRHEYSRISHHYRHDCSPHLMPRPKSTRRFELAAPFMSSGHLFMVGHPHRPLTCSPKLAWTGRLVLHTRCTTT